MSRVHLSKLREIHKYLIKRELCIAKSWENFWNLRLDTTQQCVNFLIPPKRGTPVNWECVLRTFGTANWKLNFVPASAKATAGKPSAEEENRGREIEFFCGRNVRKSWFFDIYIQGSKKVQL